MQQLTQNFIIVARAQSSTRQCLREYIFYLIYVFVLKLRESLFKKIVKSIFRCLKTINSPKKIFLKEITLQRMICTRHSSCTVRADDN